MINKYNGCLLGLAIGDALGAPVESLSYLTLRENTEKEVSLILMPGIDSGLAPTVKILRCLWSQP